MGADGFLRRLRLTVCVGCVRDRLPHTLELQAGPKSHYIVERDQSRILSARLGSLFSLSPSTILHRLRPSAGATDGLGERGEAAAEDRSPPLWSTHVERITRERRPERLARRGVVVRHIPVSVQHPGDRRRLEYGGTPLTRRARRLSSTRALTPQLQPLATRHSPLATHHSP